MLQFIDCFADKGKGTTCLKPKDESKCKMQEHSDFWIIFTHTAATVFQSKNNYFSQYFESDEALFYLILQENI